MAPRRGSQPRSERDFHVDAALGRQGGIGAAADERFHVMADHRVARVAATQRGLVTYQQLLDAGLTPRAIRTRVEAGRLHRKHRGVYAVGHPALPPLGAEQAALLACGPGAVLSHRSAAVVRGLLAPREGPVDVMRPPPHRRGPRENEAQLRRLVDPDELRHARRLREILEGGPTPTRSEAERRLLGLLHSAGLPRPITNVRVAGHEVDALWPEHRLIVEVDGFAYHRSRFAFERDRLRDADLHLAGYAVIRLTWRQLTDRPPATIARLAAALATRDPRS